MGFFDVLGKLNPIAAIIEPTVSKLLNLIPDPQKREEMRLETLKELDKFNQAIVEAQAAIDVKQAEINIEEAKSTNWLIAGARPALMWVFVLSFTWQYVVLPMVSFGLTVSGHPVALPTLDMAVMMPVLLGMLGLSTQRTVEKIQDVTQKH
jgi:hypothetical protein